MKALIDLADAAGASQNVLDQEFIRTHTNGFETFKAQLVAANQTRRVPSSAAAQFGLF